jgi:hypothetical protein
LTLRDELRAILAADLPSEDDALKLAGVLYKRCYTASILDTPAAAAKDEDLLPALAAANRSRAVWDEGWRIDQLLEGGRILARKGGATRAFLPGEYLTHRGLGSGPAAGAIASILCVPSCIDLQPSYYYAFSETVSDFDDGDRMVRFFWNVSREGAPRLLGAVTRELNRFQIPFRFKCGRRASEYPRRDAAVLYLHAAYYPIAALVLEVIHAEVRTWLAPGTPLFTKRLADGLAFAEDPGESFGENRMKILAAAMFRTLGRPVNERLEEVRLQFEQRSLSLDRPWLNPGSLDFYEFPFPVS